MILVAALAVFCPSFLAASKLLARSGGGPAQCVRQIDAFIVALYDRLGDASRPVPLHVQDQMQAAMADVTAALRKREYAAARAVALENQHLTAAV